jgi:hypothetical protein
MMEAVRAYETSVHCNETTRRYIPEDSKTLYSPPWEPEISQMTVELMILDLLCNSLYPTQFLPGNNTFYGWV